jgi:hypothetical protein
MGTHGKEAGRGTYEVEMGYMMRSAGDAKMPQRNDSVKSTVKGFEDTCFSTMGDGGATKAVSVCTW